MDNQIKTCHRSPRQTNSRAWRIRVLQGAQKSDGVPGPTPSARASVRSGRRSAGCGVPSPSPRPYPRLLWAPRWGHLSRLGEVTEVLCGVNGASAKAGRKGSGGPWERPRAAGRGGLCLRRGRVGRAAFPWRPAAPAGRGGAGAGSSLLQGGQEVCQLREPLPAFSRRPLSPRIPDASGDSVLRQDPHFFFLTVLCLQGRPGRSGWKVEDEPGAGLAWIKGRQERQALPVRGGRGGAGTDAPP